MTPGTALARSRAGVIGIFAALAVVATAFALRSPTFAPDAAVVAITATVVNFAVALSWWLAARRMSQRSRTVETQELAALRDIVELAGIGEWRWDLRSNRVVYSRACATMLGYRQGEVGSTLSAWGKLAHPEDLPRLRALVDELCDGRISHYEARVRLRAADGSWQTIIDRGRITVRDADGKPIIAMGVHIDVSRLEPGSPAHPLTPVPAAHVTTTRGACLVVDDDPSVRVVVEIAGRRAGMRMLTFPDAESAWQAIVDGGTPLAIVTDFDMPGPNGIELAQRVRDAGLACPVLLMTGRPREDFARCDVVRGVLGKPFALGELTAWLTALAMGAEERAARD